MKSFYVYILTNQKNGTLYIGVTNYLLRRIDEHKRYVVEGFTKKCQLHKLVYFDATDDVSIAIERETRLKAWKRRWKLELIEKMNPSWKDLYGELF